MTFGLIPSSPSLAPWGVCGAVDDSPDECLALSSLVRRGGNQGPSQTCVWWGLAGAVYGTLQLLGLGALWPSVRAGYYLTQMRTHAGDRKRLVDIGCRPTDAVGVLREVGIVQDSAWPWQAIGVLDEPDLGALITAPDRDWIKAVRLDAYGDSLRRQMKHPLSRPGRDARLVVQGMAVDRAALTWNSQTMGPYVRTGPVAGYHMELIPYYLPEGVGKVSSWGLPDRVDTWEQATGSDVTETWIVDIDEARARAMLAGGGQ